MCFLAKTLVWQRFLIILTIRAIRDIRISCVNSNTYVYGAQVSICVNSAFFWVLTQILGIRTRYKNSFGKNQVKVKVCFFNLDTIWIELEIKLDTNQITSSIKINKNKFNSCFLLPAGNGPAQTSSQLPS